MKNKNIHINYKSILILLIIFILAGCNRSPQKPDVGTKNELPKLPKVLIELENEVLKVMYDLDSITGIEEAITKKEILETKETADMKTAAKSDKQNSKDSEKSKTEDNKSGTSEEDESEQMQETVDMQELIVENEIIIPLLDVTDVEGSFAEDPAPPANIETVWNEIDGNVTEIHRKWNVLEAQLPSERTSLERTEDFEKILDDLTLSVMNREIYDSLRLANELTGATTNFRSYFDSIGSHDVHRMYYYIRNTILSAASDNYSKALEHLKKTEKIGDSIRQDLMKKDAEDIFKKFELSMEDLEIQLKDENFYLSKIKAPIVIKNIKLIQDVFETQK